jgi:hypothetical protein
MRFLLAAMFSKFFKRQVFCLILVLGCGLLSSQQLLAATSPVTNPVVYQDLGKVKAILRSFLIEQ